MERNIFFLSIFLLYFVHTCYSQSPASDEPKEVSINDFPMTIGSQWTYLRVDTTGNSRLRPPTYVIESETVTVQITKTDKTKHKGIISERVRTFPSKVDTQFVVIKRDTLKLFTSMDPAKRHEVFQFVFPLKVGNSWYGPPYVPASDSYLVVEQVPLEVAAGVFTEAYLIEREIWIPNNLIHIKYWVVPKIGIVKINKRDQYFGKYEIEDWELIKHKVRE